MVEIYWDDLTEEKQREILEVFGDNQNDISMLELTPNSYAMEHAKPDVIPHASHTCKSVTEKLREFLKEQS